MNTSRKSIDINNTSTFRVVTLVGQAIGGIAFILGFVLFLLGITGTVELLISSNTLTAKLLNGSPGVIFALAGMIIVWRYKPKGSSTVVEEHIVERYGAERADTQIPDHSSAPPTKPLSVEPKAAKQIPSKRPLFEPPVSITSELYEQFLKIIPDLQQQMKSARPPFKIVSGGDFVADSTELQKALTALKPLPDFIETRRTSRTEDRAMRSG